MNMAKESDLIIFSSNDSYKDFKNFAPEYFYKGRILHFVVIPDSNIYNEDNNLKEDIEKKYGIKGKYFYIPNQFWKHKNHTVVFEAVKILKNQGFDITIVCTGYMNDYRHTNYVKECQEYVKSNDLENNVYFLGLVEYKEVQFLFRNAVSVINPSLFEGWSTTVEEAKSIGKNIILSDIPVHREQNPPEGVYFNPKNPQELAEILKEKWLNSNGGPDYKLEEKAGQALPNRTKDFALAYQDIVLELF
jgi:glycosyltransferase involved in cell wall biosynthesis